MVSSYWSNIDPDGWVQARCYPMRMTPSWKVSLDYFCSSSTNLHTNMVCVSIGAHKYAACFYWRPQICSVFLLAPTNMQRVSICAHRQVIFLNQQRIFKWKHGTSFYCRHRQNVFMAQQHKFRQKYDEAFYWVEQQHGFAWKFFIPCLHVGEMLFSGNKYLLLKRITVQNKIMRFQVKMTHKY